MILGWLVCCLVVSAVVLRVVDDWISRQMTLERDNLYVNAEARPKLAQAKSPRAATDEAVLLGPVSAWVAEGEARAVRAWETQQVAALLRADIHMYNGSLVTEGTAWDGSPSAASSAACYGDCASTERDSEGPLNVEVWRAQDGWYWRDGGYPTGRDEHGSSRPTLPSPFEYGPYRSERQLRRAVRRIAAHEHDGCPVSGERYRVGDK